MSSSPGTLALFLPDFFVVVTSEEDAGAFADLLDEEAIGVGCFFFLLLSQCRGSTPYDLDLFLRLYPPEKGRVTHEWLF